MAAPKINHNRIVTADMLKNLPEPAQRYMNYTWRRRPALDQHCSHQIRRNLSPGSR